MKSDIMKRIEKKCKHAKARIDKIGEGLVKSLPDEMPNSRYENYYRISETNKKSRSD